MLVDDRFLIRSYQEGDEKAILDLFQRSFHLPLPAEDWRWKYQDNPWGNGRISVAVETGARLVGHYAGYPIPFSADGVALLGHQVGDTMTEPMVRHIGRGPTSILGRTAKHFYTTFCEGRVAFNYGFNVANIQKFSRRFLSAEQVETVTYRCLSAASLLHLSRLERYRSTNTFERVAEVTSEYDTLFEQVSRHYGFCVRRDARYLRWRYLDRPSNTYEVIAIRKWRHLVGWLVFRIRDQRFTIGDVLVQPRHVASLLVALRHLVPSYPVDLVEGWFPTRPQWFSEALSRSGFEIRPEPQDLSLMCVPFTMANPAARMRESLYYTWGDSDLF